MGELLSPIRSTPRKTVETKKSPISSCATMRRSQAFSNHSAHSRTLQLDALAAAGCGKVFHDEISGAATKRPGLDAALAALQPGDVLTVWRLGRSTPHLVTVVNDLAQRGIGFQSITEAMDTTTAGGELIFHVMAALAQFERRLIAERSRAGIAAARRRGKHLGRPADLTPDKVSHARQMIENGEQSVSSVAKLLGVHGVTLHAKAHDSGAVLKRISQFHASRFEVIIDRRMRRCKNFHWQSPR